jgi:hypothetical protein
MAQESQYNQDSISLGAQKPTKYSFDIYRAELINNHGTHELEFSNVISWELFVAKMTRTELKGLADFINNYLENN